MHLFRPINLFLSSSLGLILFACSPTTGYQLQSRHRISEVDLNTIIPETESLVFKTKIDLYNNHYSGLLVVKQTDSLTKHLTFVTEIGMKMFDFEVQGQALKPVFVFEPINKPKIISSLSNDLQLLFLLKLFDSEATLYSKEKFTLIKTDEKNRIFYYCDSSQHIQRIKVKGSLNTKISVNYLYNSKQNLETIDLKHKGLVPIRMKLTVISQSNL